jgi:adenylylsulfate kinase
MPSKQRSFTLWFTGLPSSGKSTLADAVFTRMKKSGRKLERLDGDSVRAIFPQTGFDRNSRNDHIRRIGYLASILEKNGIIVIASFVSPYRESRDFVRSLCKNFIEVHVSASVDVCEKRDVKGLYLRARKGEIQNFTGVDDPYEEPLRPELIVRTDIDPERKCIQQIMKYLSDRFQ